MDRQDIFSILTDLYEADIRYEICIDEITKRNQRISDKLSEIEEIKSQISELKKRLEEEEKKLEEKEEEIKVMERNIKNWEAMTKKSKAKEKIAIEREIGDGKKEIKRMENEALQIIKEEDDIKSKIQEFETELNIKLQELESLKNGEAAELTKLKEESEKLQETRAKIIEALKNDYPGTYSKYIMISKKNPGKALSQLLDETCSVCYAQTPKNISVKVNQGNVMSCPNCQSILFIHKDNRKESATHE